MRQYCNICTHRYVHSLLLHLNQVIATYRQEKAVSLQNYICLAKSSIYIASLLVWAFVLAVALLCYYRLGGQCIIVSS